MVGASVALKRKLHLLLLEMKIQLKYHWMHAAIAK